MFSSIQEVLTYTNKEQKNPELLALIMWTLWHRRNQVQTSPKDYPLFQVVPTVSQVLADFKQVNSTMWCKPKALFNPELDGHHCRKVKLKLILMGLNSEILARQVWESLSETAEDKQLLLCQSKQVFHSLQR